MSHIGDQFKCTQTQSEVSSSKTQLIESCSSNSSEESEYEDQGTPSQTTIIKQLCTSRNLTQTTSSPVFPAKKRSFRARQDESAEKKKACQSPVFSTQTLKTAEVVKRSSIRVRRRILDQESPQSTQIVKSTPSSQINTNDDNLKGDASHETTQISSMPTSSKSFQVEKRDVQEKKVEESTEPQKREKPLKNGLEEQFFDALRNMVSDKTINEEMQTDGMPLKTLKAKIVNIERALNIFTVGCQNRKMESESYQEFDLIFPASDKYKPLIENKYFIEGSDIVIDGPWTSFCDLKGKNTIGNVDNIELLPNSSVIVREELTSETKLLCVSD